MKFHKILLLFVLIQKQETLGLIEVDGVIEFLTSNEISATQFDFFFILNQKTDDPGSIFDKKTFENSTYSITLLSLYVNSNSTNFLEFQRSSCNVDIWGNRKVVIFNADQLTELEELVEIFSAISSLPCKSEYIFIITWPRSLNPNIEIPKLMPSSKENTFSPFIDLESDVYLLHSEEGKEFNYTLTELYKIKSHTPVILQNIAGHMQDKVGLTSDVVVIHDLLRKAHRRNDFQYVEIRGVAEQASDFEHESLMRINQTTGELEFISGEAVGIFHNLRDATRFKEMAVNGNGYAFPWPNGSLGGMGAQIRNGEADISISFSEIVPFRVHELQFLHPVSEERIYVYFRQPASNAFRDIYLHAFSPMLWLVYLILWFVLCASIMLFVWIKTHIEKVCFEEDLALVYEYVLWAVASISQQGWYAVPHSISVKMAALTGMVTGFILYTAFCGSLVSILSLPVLAIKSFQNILDNKFTIYGEHLSIAVTQMLQHDEGFGPFDPSSLINPHDAMTKVMEEPNTAFISPVYSFFLPTFQTGRYNESSVCSAIFAIPLKTTPTRAGMFVRKGSPFKDIFNAKILHLIETGIRRRLVRRYKEQQSFTCMTTEDATTPRDAMEIKDVFTAIAILIMGFILSTLIFLIEKSIQYLKPIKTMNVGEQGKHLHGVNKEFQLADLGFFE